MTRGTRGTPLNTVVGAAGVLLLGLAVVRELRRPPGLRTWHGEVLGVVPYDLRRPTLARVRDAWWSPDDDHLLLPRALGVGWSVNLARLVRLVRPVPSGTPARTHRPGGDRAA